jgi:Uma2 family endonuclease
MESQSLVRIETVAVTETPGESYRIPAEYEPDISHIITEDDTPVDNIFSERQQRFLTQTLNTTWKPGRPFVALSNVGVFYGLHKPPIVPDMLLSLDVEPNKGVPNLNLAEKQNRSYFVWEYGKPPDLVIEIVSNLQGGELDRKLGLYAGIGIDYYVVFDPFQEYGPENIRAFALARSDYEQLPAAHFDRIGLRLERWRGVFEGFDDEWIRWFTNDGVMLPNAEELYADLGAAHRELGGAQSERDYAKTVAQQEHERANTEHERVNAERERANAERERANAERERANAEHERANALAERLRTLGIDPEAL